MESIFILGTVQAIFLSILVYNKKNKSTGDYVLGTWLAFMGLHLLYHYLQSTGFLFRHPHLLGTGIAFSLLEGPFIYIYVLVMISKTGRFRPLYLLHGIPFMLFSIYFTFEFYLLNAEEKIQYINQLYIEMPRDLYVISLPMIFFGPIYVILALVKLRSHAKNIAMNFSYTERINLDWLRNVLLFVGFVWIIVVLANIFVKFPFMSTEMHEHLQFIALTIAVFFLGYFGIRQQAIYKPVPGKLERLNPGRKSQRIDARERYRHSGLKHTDAEKYSRALLEYFKNDQPYLNGRLSLNEVAAHLDVSSNHLSQVINEQLGMSFFDFVNSYRVQALKAKLADPSNRQFTLLAMAHDCGFNSKSSFNSIFKKFTGVTPSQYLKMQTT